VVGEGMSQVFQLWIALDRAYLIALRDGRDVRDPRLGPAVKPGWEWVGELHAAQRERFRRGG